MSRAGAEAVEARARAPRLLSLDAFRGMTIAGMLIVNDPGARESYRPLKHAFEFEPSGHGCTPTDWIFPFFLVAIGVSMTFSFAARKAKGDSDGKLLLHVLRRSAILFGLGLLLRAWPIFDLTSEKLASFRITGVLQRIALCVLFASPIVLKTRARGRALISAALLLGYWALMALVPVPGHASGDYSPQGNLSEYIDATVLGRHRLGHRELLGLISTLPAIANTLIGALAGDLLRWDRSPSRKITWLVAAGAAFAIAGWIWGGFAGPVSFLSLGAPQVDARWVFPINKPLWTSSYVLYNCGLAAIVLAACYWVVDLKGVRRWAMPFVVFGTNAILTYVLSGLHERTMDLIKWNVDGRRISLHRWILEKVFLPVASPINASWLYAVTFTLFWMAVMAVLYRRKIFWKI